MLDSSSTNHHHHHHHHHHHQCTGETHFDPLFPSSSPYVLTVGATMLMESKASSSVPVPSSDPICKDNKGCATSTHEVVCTYPTSGITSGGGFGAFAARQSFQSSAVEAYLAKAKGAGLPPASTFNATAHAYPDVSLVGNNYAVYFGVLAGAGFWIPTDGTSASTPVVAGMIALMKSKLGKKLGMVAPLLYALPVGSDVFNDITEGSNGCSSTCCGKAGFPATKGWDAATGLGSLDAGKLLAALPGMIREAERNSGE